MSAKPVLPIKVLLADDSEIMREAIKKLLVDWNHAFRLLGKPPPFRAAMQLVADFKPEILLSRFAPATEARFCRLRSSSRN